MNEEPRQPTVGASIGMTINLGNFENQKVDIWLTGIPINASDEYIAEQLQKAPMTLHKVVEALATEMARRIEEDYGKVLMRKP